MNALATERTGRIAAPAGEVGSEHLIHRAYSMPAGSNFFRRAIIAGGTAILFSACQVVSHANSLPRSASLLGNERRTSFSKEQTQKFLHTLGGCDGWAYLDVDDTWTPTDHDIRLVDEVLPKALASALGDTVPSPAAYYFQYFGLQRHGRRYVLVNGFHEFILRELDSKDDWKREPIVPCDAGKGTFQTQYDIFSQQLGPIRFGS